MYINKICNSDSSINAISKDAWTLQNARLLSVLHIAMLDPKPNIPMSKSDVAIELITKPVLS